MAQPELHNAADIKAKLEATQRQYHDGVHTLPAAALSVLTETMKELRKALSDCYSAGASPCPDCGNLPHGMERRPGLFEVGCLACLPRIVLGNGGKLREVRAAQGKTAQDAVANWNGHRWLREPVVER
jgi:hypothetical protein